jgi:hypothetical protein
MCHLPYHKKEGCKIGFLFKGTNSDIAKANVLFLPDK